MRLDIGSSLAGPHEGAIGQLSPQGRSAATEVCPSAVLRRTERRTHTNRTTEAKDYNSVLVQVM